MPLMLTPQTTYIALLIVQALHLLYHRLVKRHISFAEVISALVVRAAVDTCSGCVVDGNSHNAHRRATRRQPMDKEVLARLVDGYATTITL